MDYANKRGDLILPQGTFVYIQDGASGLVQVAVGPYKESIGEIDKIVIFDENTRKFVPSNDSNEAIQVARSADEGQYIVLINPAEPKENEPKFPNRGKNSTTITLKTGSKVNIPGPATFPLWPGQIGKVLDGHNLKYNEYLIVRVYNEEQAKLNLANAVIKSATDEGKSKKPKSLIAEEDLVTGKLLVIKGTDVSFYIPPTGIEVVQDNGKYVRKAVTLERLEYCILLDQNGDKRYLKGPAVVFPKPTEEFLEQDGKKKFKALELNDNMGIYLKVIADYEEDGRQYKTGEELFITGKEQKIYFPREEHAIIKYDERVMHYAVAITGGEARYVLNKELGEITLFVGPKMFIPDPRKEVIVKRVLDEKTVKLWFPDSVDAVQHNRTLEQEMSQSSDMLGELGGRSNAYVTDRGFSKASKSYSASLNIADEMARKNTFTKPRTLTMDSKYEGAVTINVWPGFAVQIVKKTGEREVVVGPKVRLLEFDETLEVLELSTGKPKSDNILMKTVYLQTENNIVSDIIDAETKDLVDVKIRLSYRVNFTGDNKKWFNVSNYVKLMTQHLRSIVRNRVKKLNIEDFNNNAADILRDTILGAPEEGKKRIGKVFEENGMSIYDIEVLNITIGDSDISYYLKDYQKHIVHQNLQMNKLQKDLDNTKKEEDIKRQILEENSKTEDIRITISKKNIEKANELELLKVNATKEKQTILDDVAKMAIEIQKLNDEQLINVKKEKSEIRTIEYEKQMGAIQPRLVEAMITLGGVKTTEILARNLKEQGGNLTAIFQKGGIDDMLGAIKGTPLYDNLIKLMEDYKDLGKK
jgi:major vault protein